MDGWSPDYSVTDDIGDERRELSLNPSLVNASPQPAAKQRSDELRGNHHEVDIDFFSLILFLKHANMLKINAVILNYTSNQI